MSARSGGLKSWKGRKDGRKEVVERKMLTKPMRATKATNAVRVGLIVTSWAFVVLGFMLMYSA